MTDQIKETLIGWAQEYNDPKYFQEDPCLGDFALFGYGVTNKIKKATGLPIETIEKL